MPHQKTGFYYKGYAMFVLDQNEVTQYDKCANKMIEDDRQRGESEENIKKTYLRKMESYFNHLKQFKTPGLDHPSLDDIKRLVKDIPEYTLQKFVLLWSTTVLTLLKLSVINNDNDNGLIVISEA